MRIARLGWTALYCFSAVTVVTGCIPFINWEEMLVMGGEKQYYRYLVLINRCNQTLTDGSNVIPTLAFLMSFNTSSVTGSIQIDPRMKFVELNTNGCAVVILGRQRHNLCDRFFTQQSTPSFGPKDHRATS